MRYKPQSVALLTQHKKARFIAPELAPLGLEVLTTSAYDTDLLGSFSGSTARTLTPLECAKRKAMLACELTGQRLGLGSEGSFGGGPMPGLVNWDEEILVLYDAKREYTIVATAAGPVALRDFGSADIPQLARHIAAVDIGQAWLLHYQLSTEPTEWHLVKDLHSSDAVLQAWQALLEDARVVRDSVRIQPDYRAMNCPARQGYIKMAAAQLRARLSAECPACGAVNFWQTGVQTGLPCAQCQCPTSLPKATITSCSNCGHEEVTPVAAASADPIRCGVCNP